MGDIPGRLRPLVLLSRRDLRITMTSMATYGVVAAFVAVSGLFFNFSLIVGREASLRLFVDTFYLLVVLVVPLVAARSFADERRTGSSEYLFTLPAGPWAVVTAKYLSTLSVALLAILATFAFPVALEFVGDPDWGPIMGQYLGGVLLAVAVTAPGVTVSILTRSQALAAVLALTLNLALWFGAGAATQPDAPGAGLLRSVSPTAHLDMFARGLLTAGDIVWFPAFALVWIVAAAELTRVEALRR